MLLLRSIDRVAMATGCCFTLAITVFIYKNIKLREENAEYKVLNSLLILP